MSPGEALERAKRVMAGQGYALSTRRLYAHYGLGKGGRDPAALFPWTPESRRLDCSGFVMWCLGRDRKEGNFWWNTDSILHDARVERHRFRAVENPEEGDVVVYGAGGKIGHVGLVSGPGRAIHCSAGNYRATGNAVQETSDALFRRHPDCTYARPLDYGPAVKLVP